MSQPAGKFSGALLAILVLKGFGIVGTPARTATRGVGYRTAKPGRCVLAAALAIACAAAVTVHVVDTRLLRVAHQFDVVFISAPKGVRALRRCSPCLSVNVNAKPSVQAAPSDNARRVPRIACEYS